MRRNGQDALPHYIMALRGGDSAMRENAARAVGAFGVLAAPALAELRGCLGDEEADVRRWSVWAIGRIGPQASEAMADLQACLQDPEPAVREAADEAIERIQGRWDPNKWKV